MRNTVELTEVVSDRKYRMQMLALRMMLALATIVVASHYIVLGSKFAATKISTGLDSLSRIITRTEVVRELVPITEVSLDELIRNASAEFKLHPVILQAIVLKESAGGSDKFLYRFEPGVFASRERLDAKFSEDERRMRSSSHGITQVMGYRAQPDCGVHWSKLYDNAIALNCAAKIMRMNLDASKGEKNHAKQLRTAYRMYNGSGPMAEAYADKAMASVGELLFAQLREGL